MASMIYGVSRNGRKGIRYKGKVSQHKKVKDLVIKHTPLKYHFTYGHTHDLKYTSNDFSAKPTFKHNFGNSNKQGPKKIWIPNNKIIYVADIFNSKVETPILTPGFWMLSTHGGKKTYVQKPEI